jgi:hypothetical protein
MRAELTVIKSRYRNQLTRPDMVKLGMQRKDGSEESLNWQLPSLAKR